MPSRSVSEALPRSFDSENRSNLPFSSSQSFRREPGFPKCSSSEANPRLCWRTVEVAELPSIRDVLRALRGTPRGRTPMQFTPFAMLLCVLLGRWISERWPYLPADRGILGAFLIVIGSAALARISMAYAAVTIDLHGSVRDAYRTATRLRSAAHWLWILGSPLLLAGCGWGTTAIDLASHFGWRESSLFSIAFWSIPTVAFLFFADYAWYEFETVARSKRFPSAPKSSPLLDSSFVAFEWNQFKHTWLLIVVPTLLSCLLLDVAHGWQVEKWSLVERTAVYGLTIAIGLLLLPEGILLAWNGRPLEPSDKSNAIHAAWTKLGLERTAIRSWTSQKRVCNAVVLGFFPWRRRLMLSDLLIERLSMPQMEMVLCHEAAHIQRHHFLLRACPFLVSLVSLLAFRTMYDGDLGWRTWADSHEWIVAAMALCKLAIVLWLSSVIGKWTEKDADRRAIELAASHGLGGSKVCTASSDPSVGSVHEPALHLMAALASASQGTATRRSSWLYPSIWQRCQAVRETFALPSAVGSESL